MQKENIIINSIQKDFAVYNQLGIGKVKRLLGMKVNFDFKCISDCNISIKTDSIMTEEEIKDKIIEVLQ